MKNVNDREINDLSRNIQVCMTRSNEIFAAIGRMFYNQNAENPSEEYVQMFNDLKANQDQIENMQTRIKFLNGIVVCTNCKAENSINSSFCSVCGTRLPHTYATDGASRCSKCGNIIQPGQKFCNVCGTKFDEPAPVEQPVVEQPVVEQPVAEQPVVQQPVAEQPAAEQPVVQQSVAEQPVPEQPAERRCPQCGMLVTASDAVFCEGCGCRL